MAASQLRLRRRASPVTRRHQCRRHHCEPTMVFGGQVIASLSRSWISHSSSCISGKYPTRRWHKWRGSRPVEILSSRISSAARLMRTLLPARDRSSVHCPRFASTRTSSTGACARLERQEPLRMKVAFLSSDVNSNESRAAPNVARPRAMVSRLVSVRMCSSMRSRARRFPALVSLPRVAVSSPSSSLCKARGNVRCALENVAIGAIGAQQRGQRHQVRSEPVVHVELDLWSE
jgi:hypothetical protein